MANLCWIYRYTVNHITIVLFGQYIFTFYVGHLYGTSMSVPQESARNSNRAFYMRNHNHDISYISYFKKISIFFMISDMK